MAARATITQVARRLGVAPSTVSRAFNEPRLLRPETVSRVRAAADEMGYVASRHARALVTGRAGAIGLIVPDITNPFFPMLIRYAHREAQGLDQAILVAETNSNPEQERHHIASLRGQTEGLIIVSSRLPGSELRQLATEVRIVLINNDTESVDRVLITSRSALNEGIRHLAATGTDRICYIGGPSQSWSESERRSTVISSSKQLSLATILFRNESGSYAGALRLTDQLIARNVRAVVAFDDVVAHGVMDGLADRGLRVPQDLRILGCDDALPIQTRPRLSTIRLRSRNAVREAIRLLTGADSQGTEHRIDSRHAAATPDDMTEGLSGPDVTARRREIPPGKRAWEAEHHSDPMQGPCRSQSI